MNQLTASGIMWFMGASSAPEPIGQSLIHTVSNMPQVKELASQYGELTLDSLVDSGLADKIPIVGTARAMFQLAGGIREALLLRKLVAMLTGLGEIEADEAATWSKKLKDDGHVEEFGERVIGVVDRLESATKAKIVGQMLREFVKGDCDRDSFLRSTEMIDRALTEDLTFLLEHSTEDYSHPACERLIAIGLMTDRSATLELESSMPPALSSEGELIRKASRS